MEVVVALYRSIESFFFLKKRSEKTSRHSFNDDDGIQDIMDGNTSWLLTSHDTSTILQNNCQKYEK